VFLRNVGILPEHLKSRTGMLSSNRIPEKIHDLIIANHPFESNRQFAIFS
jgi:hypothetical protein